MIGLSTNPSMSFRPFGMLRKASHERSEGRETLAPPGTARQGRCALAAQVQNAGGNLQCVPLLDRFGCGALSPLHGPGDSSRPFDCAQGRSE